MHECVNCPTLNTPLNEVSRVKTASTAIQTIRFVDAALPAALMVVVPATVHR